MIPTSALPFRFDKLLALVRFIVRGLAVYHWQTHIPADYAVGAGTLSRDPHAFLSDFIAKHSQVRAANTWGNGIFQYEGIQSVADPGLTFWRFSAYGGLRLCGDPELPDEVVSDIWATTASQLFPGLLYG